ncbi:MAG: hypothetical protein QOG54_430 [Actinomycetota bacterium]|jgi:hypothetical protein|nr:hypothetical protein [Actinomycetota bacterium]
MRRFSLLFAALVVLTTVMSGLGYANGPGGSKECHVKNDDCDNATDEDTGTASDDVDHDGRIDEDSPGDTNLDGNNDDDLDGLIDEDWADDDNDGKVNEDPPGNALNDAGGNQVDCGDGMVPGAPVSIYAGANGVEACDDNATTPIDGRVIVDFNGRYATIDGDNSNPGPGNGYARVDQGGVHCGDDAENQDSGANQSGNGQDDCG